jgi:hypothetical protein
MYGGVDHEGVDDDDADGDRCRSLCVRNNSRVSINLPLDPFEVCGLSNGVSPLFVLS